MSGPYWTGAVTPSGNAALFRCPHVHSLISAWCSVTSILTGGTSNTWRLSMSVAFFSFSEQPHFSHFSTWCRMVCSGFSTIFRVCPGWPGCPPDLRSPRGRKLRGAGLSGPSLEGGLLLLWLFLTNCSFKDFSSSHRALFSAYSSHNALTTASWPARYILSASSRVMTQLLTKVFNQRINVDVL